MDKDKARFAHRQSRRSHSKERGTRESTSTTRATKRDRPRADRSPLSSRINQFARQLEHRHSASSTARDKNPRGATTEPAMQPVMSNLDVARPSAPPQSRECREQSATSVMRAASPPRKIDKRKKTCAACGEIMYARNWMRHLERCHVDTGTEQPSGTTGKVEPRVVATARQGSNRRSRMDTVCAKSTIRRCVSLVYPLQCLNVPLSVQLSCARKRLIGMSSRDRWTCVNSVSVLVSKMRSELSMALPLMRSQHLARPRVILSQQDSGPGSETSKQVHTPANVHSKPALLHDLSFITTEGESVLSTEEHTELQQSVMTEAEPPNLSGEEVEANLLDTDVTIVKERIIPYDILKQRYLVKRATRPPANQLASSGGGNTQEQQSAAGAASSSSLVAGTSKSGQPVQSCATIVQHVPDPNLVASHTATSSATHTEARQDHGEKRGSPSPRHMSRSTRSRTPTRERYGYQRRDARWENRSRSPRRLERRVTPRPSPGRRLSLERGRGEPRRSARYDRDREPTSDEGTKRLFEAFLSFMHRSRD